MRQQEKGTADLPPLHLPHLGLGGAGLGGAHYGEVSQTQAILAVERALAGGLRYLDTSPAYGQSEGRIGRALRGVPRSSYQLSTKVGTRPGLEGYRAEAVRRSLAHSLEALNTDYLDLVLVHDPPDLAQVLAPGGALEALEDLRAQGTVGAIGLGVRSLALHRQALASGRFQALLTFLDYTLLRQDARALFDEARRQGVALINGSPLAMGLLGGGDPRAHRQTALHWIAPDEPGWGDDVARAEVLWRWSRERQLDLAALAIQYSLRQPAFACTLVGATSAPEVERTLRACEETFADEVWRELEVQLRTSGGIHEDH
ncbi:aldo/keto reductase [Deinococcus sp.]|uniref:aldo/keto reductase n=1 Tax=Deinococcus sp. TaxID=47478 RepID=UPI003C7BF4EB